jgi:hypothetical protein
LNYAIIELLFAIGLTVSTIGSLPDQIGFPEGAKLIAAVYIFVRGMDNMKKDIEERAKLPPFARGRIITLGLADKPG